METSLGINFIFLIVFSLVLFDAAKRTKNGLTILTHSAYRLRLNGKSSIWRLRQFLDGQSHETRRSELLRALAGLFKRTANRKIGKAGPSSMKGITFPFYPKKAIDQKLFRW